MPLLHAVMGSEGIIFFLFSSNFGLPLLIVVPRSKYVLCPVVHWDVQLFIINCIAMHLTYSALVIIFVPQREIHNGFSYQYNKSK